MPTTTVRPDFVAGLLSRYALHHPGAYGGIVPRAVVGDIGLVCFERPARHAAPYFLRDREFDQALRQRDVAHFHVRAIARGCGADQLNAWHEQNRVGKVETRRTAGSVREQVDLRRERA